MVLNKLLQNRRLETQRAKQNNRELQNALPKNISGWEVEPRLKQDVAEMIDERICQVAADFDLDARGEIDDLAVASPLIQTTPFQPVYAEDRISNVGGIRFYLESVMHALGEQRERPGTSPVLEATLQDYIPKLTLV